MKEDLDFDIKKVQTIQFELLVEFDRICKENNIMYQLFSGTLLGAIRHKGFIPWDDDIDVCMLREEYDKFLTVYKKELNEQYFLQNYETDPLSMFHFSKLIKNNTIYRTNTYRDIDMNHGIFIDIFPMDNVKPNTKIGNIHRMLYSFGFHVISSMNKNRCYQAKNKLTKYLRLSLYYSTKVLPKNSIHVILDKAICMFDNQDTTYVSCITNGDSKELIDKTTVERATFIDLIEWEFEGIKFPVPKEYDYILTKQYGKYLELPPVEEQKPHHGIIEVNFDTTINK